MRCLITILSLISSAFLVEIFGALPLDTNSLFLIINDKLTDGRHPEEKLGMGIYTSNGWEPDGPVTNLGDPDRLYYILPKGTRSGIIQYEAKGFEFPYGFGDSRRNIGGVYDVFRERNELKNTSCNCNGITSRIYVRDRIKDGNLRQSAETYEIKINGIAYSPNGGEGGAVQYMNRTISWAGDKWYQIRLEWDKTKSKAYRDGVEIASIAYKDHGLSMIHAYINADYYHEWDGLENMTYRNVKIYGDVASPVRIGLKTQHSGTAFSKLTLHPNPGTPNLKIYWRREPVSANLELFDIKGDWYVLKFKSPTEIVFKKFFILK